MTVPWRRPEKEAQMYLNGRLKKGLWLGNEVEKFLLSRLFGLSSASISSPCVISISTPQKEAWVRSNVKGFFKFICDEKDSHAKSKKKPFLYHRKPKLSEIESNGERDKICIPGSQFHFAKSLSESAVQSCTLYQTNNLSSRIQKPTSRLLYVLLVKPCIYLTTWRFLKSGLDGLADLLR